MRAEDYDQAIDECGRALKTLVDKHDLGYLAIYLDSESRPNPVVHSNLERLDDIVTLLRGVADEIEDNACRAERISYAEH